MIHAQARSTKGSTGTKGGSKTRRRAADGSARNEVKNDLDMKLQSGKDQISPPTREASQKLMDTCIES